MGSLHRQVAVLVPDEKLLVLIFDAKFFSKQNETSTKRDIFYHFHRQIRVKQKFRMQTNQTSFSVSSLKISEVLCMRLSYLNAPMNRWYDCTMVLEYFHIKVWWSVTRYNFYGMLVLIVSWWVEQMCDKLGNTTLDVHTIPDDRQAL